MNSWNKKDSTVIYITLSLKTVQSQAKQAKTAMHACMQEQKKRLLYLAMHAWHARVVFSTAFML
jgi:hypothetical protein